MASKMILKPKISLLAKIFLILILSTVFIQLVLVFPLAGPGNRDKLPELITWHLKQYMVLLVEKIGDPKDGDGLAKVSEQFQSDIRVETHDGLIIADSGLPSFSEIKQSKSIALIGMFLNIPVGSRDGRLYYAHETPKYNYVFSPRNLKVPTLVNRTVRFLLLVTFLPALISFLLIRILLRPIRILKMALERFGSGDLQTRADIRQTDEFGALALNFNKMADEINNILVARQQLVSDVSHELRSPIGRLKMAIETMPASTTKKDLSDDVEELQSLTDTILDAERIRSGVSTPILEECDIISIIHEVHTQMRTHHKISVDSLPDAMCVIADKRWAKIVLRNVIENATKYSSPDSEPIQITATVIGDFCEICVKDFGVGIAKEDLERVFEPFYRVDSSRSKTSGGFGIGLHLCKRIMSALGGSINIDSSKGEWTKVTLKFLL